MSNILTKAMLVKLSISQYNPRRADDVITREVLENHKTNRDAGIWVKNIIDPKTLSDVNSTAMQARSTHYRLSLPWADDGWRILPTVMYTKYQDEVRDRKKEFDQAVSEFINKYPQFVEDARKVLNGMFNEKDYPSIMALREKFGINVNFQPLPCGSDFRVSLEGDELSAMKSDVDQRVKDAVETAMKDLWVRLAQPIKSMAEKLREADKVFRNSLIENVKEIVDLIPSLNVTGNAELAKIAKECSAQLICHTAEDLRDNKEMRKEVQQAAEKLLKKMEGYI